MLAHTNQVPACLVAPSPSERGLGERTERGVRGQDREERGFWGWGRGQRGIELQ